MASDKVEQRLRKREVRYDRESRMKEKWSENLRVLEEVFDRRTIMTVLRFLNTGKLSELHGVVKSGKESRIYHGLTSDGKEVAVKIFLTTSAVFKQGRIQYLTGDPRFKDTPRATADIVDRWASKEFKNLRLAQEAGVKVPSPIAVEKNVLLLEFIGKDGKSSPLLRDVQLAAPTDWYRSIMASVETLYVKAKLVHCDLSEYNIMVPDGYPVIIDFGQAVSAEHPQAVEFLERDIRNVNQYFKHLKVRTVSPKRAIARMKED